MFSANHNPAFKTLDPIRRQAAGYPLCNSLPFFITNQKLEQVLWKGLTCSSSRLCAFRGREGGCCRVIAFTLNRMQRSTCWKRELQRDRDGHRVVRGERSTKETERKSPRREHGTGCLRNIVRGKARHAHSDIINITSGPPLSELNMLKVKNVFSHSCHRGLKIIKF